MIGAASVMSTGRSGQRGGYPNASLVSTGSNTGCSGGRNRQLSAACYGLVMVVDDDAFLHPSCLEELAKAVCELPDAAICSPRVCYEQDRGLVQSDRVNLYAGRSGTRQPGLATQRRASRGTTSYQIHERRHDERF